jgi:hypothetical protein
MISLLGLLIAKGNEGLSENCQKSAKPKKIWFGILIF